MLQKCNDPQGWRLQDQGRQMWEHGSQFIMAVVVVTSGSSSAELGAGSAVLGASHSAGS